MTLRTLQKQMVKQGLATDAPKEKRVYYHIGEHQVRMPGGKIIKVIVASPDNVEVVSQH